MDGRHKQRGGNSLATDVTNRDPKLLAAQWKKVVVVAADGARRLADTMQFERAELNVAFWKQLRLHLLRNGDLALQSLFFLLFADQVLQRLGHRIERAFQRGQLIFRPDLNTVTEICAVDVAGCAVEI